MKNFILLIALIFTYNAFSQTRGTAEELFCGEMDPFVVGDVCLLNVTLKNNQKLSILLDFDTIVEEEIEGTLAGSQVLIFENTLRKIYDRETLRVLRRFDEGYFYMQGERESFKLLGNKQMEIFVTKLSGYFSVNHLPEGYSAKKIKKFSINAQFKAYLNGATVAKRKAWENLVYNSGEYDHLSAREKAAIAKSPKQELEVPYLLEIAEAYGIYRHGKLIGYFLEVSDHVQAAIYQDGAWINMFLDLKQKVVKSEDESA